MSLSIKCETQSNTYSNEQSNASKTNLPDKIRDPSEVVSSDRITIALIIVLFCGTLFADSVALFSKTYTETSIELKQKIDDLMSLAS